MDRICVNQDDDTERNEQVQALLPLMEQPCSSKRRVIQEIAQPQEATLYYGQSSVHWQEFTVAVKMFARLFGYLSRRTRQLRQRS